MLIPAIDLLGGRVVQLVQGERVAIADDDVDRWVRRFSRFPRVQLIDLDAAKGSGDNDELVQHVMSRLPCRVGGGIRSTDRARRLIDDGAREVIVGSALLAGGRLDLEAAQRFSSAVGVDRLVAAVDSRAGRVVTHGWRTKTPLTATAVVRALDHACGGFLYTHVDTEGLLGGIDLAAVSAVAAATRRRLTVAGGIRSQEEVDALDRLGIDAVVGMAVYTGLLAI